ncbi:MAG: dephospho-CoA kinase [Rhodospirillaceae bacterium]
MRVVGLTGSIGMGKSTTAQMARQMGYPVHDADAGIHALLGPGGAAVDPVGKRFPASLSGDRIDRKQLGQEVFQNPKALKELEAILHPLVGALKQRFLRQAALRRARLVILDVPLLFETRGDRICDGVVVVSASAMIQRQRVLARPAMTTDKLRGILARQTPDTEKRRRADWVVLTGLGHRTARLALKKALRQAQNRPHRRRKRG